MTHQHSFLLDPSTLQVLCGDCIAAARIHYVSPLSGMRRAYYAHIECHGVRRFVELYEYVVRYASTEAIPKRVSITWDQLGDVYGLEEFARKLAQRIVEVRAREIDPSLEQERSTWTADAQATVEHARMVLRSR